MNGKSTMPDMSLSDGAIDFIDDGKLEGLLNSQPADKVRVRGIIAKSLEKKSLSLEETATLLRADDPDLIEEVFDAARELKRKVYGNRIVLFAPLYVGNLCVNDCGYCAFRRSNPDVIRRTLDTQELEKQVIALEDVGHKRLILVFGRA